MSRPSFLVAALALTAMLPVHATADVAAPPVDFQHLPWSNGEALTYLVSMGMFQAAEGKFTARQTGGHWEFKLDLASRGLVDEFYPFTGNFWSELAPGPRWRSVEYGEFRFEPHRTIKERTRVDYATPVAVRENWIDGTTKKFTPQEDALDDVGTMLFHLRAGAWQPGDRRLLHVYENGSEKEALAQCEARENRAIGAWPAQPLLHLVVLPGKGTHHRGRLELWMTDDARHLPLHADLDFRYGSFGIDLEKINGAGPPVVK